jgi:large repetitive protein
MNQRSFRAFLLGFACLLAAGAVSVLHGIQLPPQAEREEIHPGAWKFSWQTETEAGPVAIHGFYWELGRTELRVVATAGGETVRGNEEVSRQALRLSTENQAPVAAVNADFFQISGPAAGSVNGLFIRRGELLSVGEGPAAAFLDDGSIAIGELSAKVWLETENGQRTAVDRLNDARGQDELVLYTPAWGGETFPGPESLEVMLRGNESLRPSGSLVLEVVESGRPQEVGDYVLSAHGRAREALESLRPGMRVTLRSRLSPDLAVGQAVGGLPIMVRKGIVQLFPGARHEDFVPGPGDPNTRHPRTGIGTDGQHGVVVVVDGRAPGRSVGMTIPELGGVMLALGCTEALNLDGGGSSAVWARGEVLNRPSDGAERPVGNALVLLSMARESEPARIEIERGKEVRLAPGGRFRPEVEVFDRWGNPIEENVELLWTAEGGIGSVGEEGFSAGPSAVRGLLRAAANGVKGTVPVEVTDDVVRLVATPRAVRVLPGGKVPLQVVGADSRGREILLDPARLDWQTAPALGAVNGMVFRAAGKPAKGVIRIRGYGVEQELPAVIALPVVVEDFGGDLPGLSFGKIPDEVEGEILRLVDEETLNSFVRLNYSLKGERPTRAAFMHLNRGLGEAMEVRFRVRGEGRGILRLTLTDSSGARRLLTIHEGELPAKWSVFGVSIPADLVGEITLSNIYMASTQPDEPIDGFVDFDYVESVRTNWSEGDNS